MIRKKQEWSVLKCPMTFNNPELMRDDKCLTDKCAAFEPVGTIAFGNDEQGEEYFTCAMMTRPVK